MLVRPTSEVPRRSWLAWAAFLVFLYIAVSIVGWQRTLIPDEIWHLIYASGPLSDQLDSIRSDLVHPPLAYLLDRWWVEVFGGTDCAVKTLGLVQNLGTLVLFTALASRITAWWRLASFLFAVPFLRVGSSVNLVRMYGPLLLWSVAALWLWELWRERPTTTRLAAWTAVAILALYTHISGLALLAVFFVVNWVYGPRRWAFTVAAGIAALCFLPWVLYVLPVYLTRGIDANVGWIVKKPLQALGELPFTFLTGEDPGAASVDTRVEPQILRQVLKGSALLLNLALLMVAGGKLAAFWPPRREDSSEKRWFWICVFLVGIPIAGLLTISAIRRPLFHPRYLLFTLPAYWLLLTLVGLRGGRAGRVLLLGVILPWTLVTIGVSLAKNLSPSVARAGTLHIAQAWQDSDLILSEKPIPIGFQVYWEWTRRLKQTGRFEVLDAPMLEHLRTVLPGKELASIDLAGVQRIWLFWERSRDPSGVIAYLQGQGFVKNDAPALQIPTLLLLTRSISAGPSPAPASSGSAPAGLTSRSRTPS